MLHTRHPAETSGNGKAYERADIEWHLSYCQGDGVQFKANLDIDKLIAHGVPGCEYYTENAKRLGELWQAAQVLEAAAGNEWGWSFSMDHDGGHTEMAALFIEPIGDAACQTVEELEGLIEDVLTEIYEDACHRLKKIGNDEIEYQSSDEYIGELLENNPHSCLMRTESLHEEDQNSHRRKARSA